MNMHERCKMLRVRGVLLGFAGAVLPVVATFANGSVDSLEGDEPAKDQTTTMCW